MCGYLELDDESPARRRAGHSLGVLMRTASFTLPLPPSVNGMFANAGQGRVKTKGYREWRKAASAAIIAQRCPAFTGTFRLEVRASDQGLTHARDIDNCAKATADAFVHCGIIPADDFRHMRAVALEWDSELPEGTCSIKIIELSSEPIQKPAQATLKKSGRAVAPAPVSCRPEPSHASVVAALAARGIIVAASRVHVQ
jgi:Holliday junction resolvase RusA-like endonuclease